VDLRDALSAALRMIVGLDPEVWGAVWTSLKVSAGAIVLATLAGVPAGLAVATGRFRGRRAVVLLLNTLMALPTVVVGLLLYALLGRRGPLGGLGALYTPSGMVAGEFLLAAPIVANLTISAVRGVDPRVLLTCRSFGASWGRTAWVVVREARFAVMAAVVAGFGRVIGEVGIAMMVGGNIRGFTRTMTTAIALETSKGEFELGLALGVVLLLAALGVNALLYLLQEERSAGHG